MSDTKPKGRSVGEELAREIIRFCLANDVLTQHGMRGLRRKMEEALSGADSLHACALKRIEKLMDALPGSPEAEELSALANAVQAYEDLIPPIAGRFKAPEGTATLDELIEQNRYRETPSRQ